MQANSGRRIRWILFRWSFSIRHTARAWRKNPLISARDGGWLTPDALLVVEEAANAGFKAPDGFVELERRRYDDTEFIFIRLS